jgi:hypothetical protein
MMCNVYSNKNSEYLSLTGVGMIFERERERERDNQQVRFIEDKRKTIRFPANIQSPGKNISGGIFMYLSEPVRDRYTAVKPCKIATPMVKK